VDKAAFQHANGWLIENIRLRAQYILEFGAIWQPEALDTELKAIRDEVMLIERNVQRDRERAYQAGTSEIVVDTTTKAPSVG